MQREFLPSMRTKFVSAVVCAIIICPAVALGQQAQAPPTKPKSPAAIAAASERMAKKNEQCRLEAKKQKLSFLKRRKYMRECKKR